MTSGTVQIATTDADVDRVCDVMLELRTAFTKPALAEQIRKQQQQGYRIAFLESDDGIVCVAGFVVATKLAWGRHIYVDDLVTAGSHRSRGAGAVMIDWLKKHARELGCEQLHLDSGVQRYGAHRFYLRHGFNIESHHFSIAEL